MAKTAANKTPAKKTAAKKTTGEPAAATKPKAGAKPDMPPPSHDQIARVAYQLWEEAGRPHGQSDEFWQRAERQLRGLGPQQPAL